MELATTLKSQTIGNHVREVGINPNHWYPVAWIHQLNPGRVMPVVVWQQPLALYRDSNGEKGQCVNIPYLPKDQKLPCAQARSYPVREKYNIIWVFPGDRALSETVDPPLVPEHSDPNCLPDATARGACGNQVFFSSAISPARYPDDRKRTAYLSSQPPTTLCGN